ncbi:hypothetical protein DTO282F9_4518 [Paecilomyces variotii]|nr:hypothetical protein DTO282F9_4518 [Paecilomyces variotii]
MAQAPRPASMFPTGRQSSYPVAQQSSALAARIASKKAELDNLKELRDLSGVLASQMQALEEKLSTLKDGTEAVACVLANWGNVLRAISMASAKIAQPKDTTDEKSHAEMEDSEWAGAPLPATLVRIPAEQSDKK